VDLKAWPVINSGWRDEKQTARKFKNLRAVRWTVWNWPRGGHSTWPLRQLPGLDWRRELGSNIEARSPRATWRRVKPIPYSPA